MRIAETDFILIPEWLAQPGGSPSGQLGRPDDDMWISRWQRSIASARWFENDHAATGEALLSQCVASPRPTVIITHGHGVEAILAASKELSETPITGAFIVAPSFSQEPSADAIEAAQSLSFPSVIVAPDDHPMVPSETAERFAQNLGGHYVSAGTVGRLDSQSGHGPWPDGLMRLGWFLKRLSAH